MLFKVIYLKLSNLLVGVKTTNLFVYVNALDNIEVREGEFFTRDFFSPCQQAEALVVKKRTVDVQSSRFEACSQ